MKNQFEKLEEKYGKEFSEKEKSISTEINPQKIEDLRGMVEIIAGKLRERNIAAVEIETLGAELLEMAIKVERMHDALEKPEPIYERVDSIDGEEFLRRILNSGIFKEGLQVGFGKKSTINSIKLQKIRSLAETEMDKALASFKYKLENRNLDLPK